MRTLLLTDSDVFAGTERHILDLAQGLRALGMDIVVAAPSPSVLQEQCAALGIDFKVIQKRSGTYDGAAVSTVERMLEREEIDLVHANNGQTLMTAVVARRRADRGAVVFTQHFLAPARHSRRGLKGWASRRIHHWLGRQVDHTIAISQAVLDASLERGDVRPDRITVVHNGVNDISKKQTRTRAQTRTDLGVSEHAPIILCSARLEREKDVGTLVDAMKRVVQRDSIATCFIAGDGQQRTDLESAIARHALQDHVKLLGFRDDIPDLLAAADVFALPAVAEPFGLSIVEAMSMSLPVVTTDAGGPREIVLHGKTGYLVAPRSPDAMADALSSLISSQALRSAMGGCGRQRFEAQFTVPLMAQRVAAIYAKVGSAHVSGATGEKVQVTGVSA
jgi:glycosyltransferase involved in cell wall biosynthesis